MARKVRSTFLYVICTIVLVGSIYHNLVRNSISEDELLRLSPLPLTSHPLNDYNQLVREERLTINHATSLNTTSSLLSSPAPSPYHISSLAILLPAWQVLVVISPEESPSSQDSGEFLCLFPNNDVSTAHPSGILPSPDRATFTCELPTRVRRRMPFPKPSLIKSTVENYPLWVSPAPDLLRWDFLVYEVVFAENDVVVFVKGLNKRQGINRAPHELNCVFGDDVADGVRTPVTSSLQEVFRCQRPDSLSSSSSLIKVSLEFSGDKRVVPSIAYGTPANTLEIQEPKSLLCACTMIYNVAKFLKEWVIYHSSIGVDKFILYDNGSEDDLYKVVNELVNEGFDISTKFWIWPKTQEAGFSHCALAAKDSCTWMMYVDVDEFVYSHSWSNSSSPSKSMLQSLLSDVGKDHHHQQQVGEIMIGCHEFGPSNQKEHPVAGVMQGYNCRRKMENRHKSIVLLDAIDDSLLNAIHHFTVKEGYRMKKLHIHDVKINHYKFQAWPEFKAKFRRRVSAYVADWTQAVNPRSNDRTPGLGFSAIEPEGWPGKFCEIHDNGLKEVSERWFGVGSPSGFHLAW